MAGGMAPGHGHRHDHPGGAGPPVRPGSEAERGRLLLVLIITAGFMGVEVVGGIVANSLALLADAGHMLTDVGALALSPVGHQARPAPGQCRQDFRVRAPREFWLRS